MAAAIAVSWGFPGALAQSSGPPQQETCNGAVLDAMKARAWMESQQEIEQNQTLVFKPDSVFEYTCFDQIVGITGEHAAPIFSETTYWGALHDSQHTDRALFAAVITPLRQWLQTNFGHTFLGGRMGVNGRPQMDYAPVSNGGGGSYTCDRMREVWKYAKCWNFGSDPKDQVYLSFDQIGPFGDPRLLPNPCAAAPVWSSGTQAVWRKNPPWFTPYSQNNQQIFQLVGQRIRPGQCGNPLPTGITVRMEGTEDFSDAVCTQPGCVYDGQQCQ